VVYRPTRCVRCGVLLLGDDPAPYRHQVTELPIVKPQVIEHQVHSIDCPCCGQRNRGKLPPEVTASWFGPNGISLVGLLMGRYRLSKRQVTHLLAEYFAIHMAASTVVNQQQVISQALAAPVAELEPVVKNEPNCNIDETRGDKGEQPNVPGYGRWSRLSSRCFALPPVEVVRLPGNCWAKPMAA
jgi:transposase